MRTGGKYRSSGPGWRPPSTERDGGAGGSGLAGLRASGVAGKVYRVGLIFTTLPVFEVDATPGGRALLEGLRQLGYEEGRNLVLERRSAEGKRERYLEIAAELVRLKTDVIVTIGTFMTPPSRATTLARLMKMLPVHVPGGDRREHRKDSSLVMRSSSQNRQPRTADGRCQEPGGARVRVSKGEQCDPLAVPTGCPVTTIPTFCSEECLCEFSTPIE